jgi:uncharacterized protein (DUF2062 family)
MWRLLWPRIGWRRSGRYIWHRAARLPDTPYRIAAGLACGAAISTTPLIGLHFLVSALLAWLVNGNIIASAVGTVVGNPWTFPFIWLWVYTLGCWILGLPMEEAMTDRLSLHTIMEHPLRVFVPMFLGSLPTAVVVWLVVFLPARQAIATTQLLRRRRLRRIRRRKVETAAASAPVEDTQEDW